MPRTRTNTPPCHRCSAGNNGCIKDRQVHRVRCSHIFNDYVKELSRNPQRVSLVYTPDSQWRNRAEFPKGREQIVEFLTRKWAKEHEYRLIKELWAFDGNRIAEG